MVTFHVLFRVRDGPDARLDMADIPNRLPAPEKRQDKINKNDMRYLLQIQRGKQRSKRRQAIDEEIDTAQRQSEKRRRAASGTSVLKRLRKVNQEAANFSSGYTVDVSDADGDDASLYENTRKVCWKQCNIPCVLGSLVGLDDDLHGVDDPDRRWTVENILEYEADAVIWREPEYGHIIQHPKVWVFCTMCHLGMRSTRIGATAMTKQYQFDKTDGTVATFSAFHVPPAVKWYVMHEKCIDDFNQREMGN